MSVSACGADSGGTPTVVPSAVVAAVSISGSTSLAAGQSVTLVAVAKNAADANILGRTFDWISSAPSVASVANTGIVTGLVAGSTTITASTGGHTGSLILTVLPPPVKSLTLTIADSLFRTNDSLVVTAKVTDVTGALVTDRTVTWVVEALSGATVSPQGVVRSARPGPMTVRATSEGITSSIDVGAYRPGFVSRLGRRFVLNGKPFFFGGVNSYFGLFDPLATYRPAVATNAGLAGASVLRLWGSFERGSVDGSVPTVVPPQNGFGTFFQRWDVAAGRPVINQGPDGLRRLDELVARASAAGMRVIIQLVDNFPASGGVDQYVVWYGGTKHDEFFTDSRMKQAYKDYVMALVTRVNTVTGKSYLSDSTVLAWELGGELQCGATPMGLAARSGCSSRLTLEPWIAEMSAYIKSLDPDHLVSTGEVGDMNQSPANPELGTRFHNVSGPDFDATLRMPTIDFNTYHPYPEAGSATGSTLSPLAWATHAITEFERLSRVANKPALLEEFGDANAASRAGTIDAMLQALEDAGGSAFVFYQIGAPKTCSPACDDHYETIPGGPGFDAIVRWIKRFNARQK